MKRYNPPFGFGEIIVELPKGVKDQKVNLDYLRASKINKMHQASLVVFPPPIIQNEKLFLNMWGFGKHGQMGSQNTRKRLKT